jgi:vancomycin resistance protein YoaR
MQRNLFWIRLSFTLIFFVTTFTFIRINFIGKNSVNTKVETSSDIKSSLSEKEITLKAGDYNKNLSIADLDGEIDVGDSENSNELEKSDETINIEEIYNDELTVKIVLNKNKLNSLIDEIYEQTYVELEDQSIELVGDEFYYNTGTVGQEVDKDDLYDLISDRIKSLDNNELNIKIEKVEPKKLSLKEFKSLVNIASQEVEFKLVNNKIEFIEPTTGYSFSEEEITEFLNNCSDIYGEKFRIPVNKILPEYNTSEVESMLFRDTLSTRYTEIDDDSEYFNERLINIKKAVLNINETIILPNETFSFNNTIGKCTTEAGFVNGGVLWDDEKYPGMGAGISQVATTLDLAVEESGLDIINKSESSYEVDYMRTKKEILVNYDNEDYQFENKNKFPIKILSWITDENKVKISIIGTYENNDSKVSNYKINSIQEN